MITPVEVLGKELRRGFGYKAVEVDEFLEELAKMLTPEVSNRMFTEEDLEEFSEIDIEVAALFMDVMEKDCFSFYEIW